MCLKLDVTHMGEKTLQAVCCAQLFKTTGSVSSQTCE